MKTILICDDNLFIRETLRVFLADIHDIKIDFAEDGQEALEKIAHKRYDLIVMDIQMPFYSGIELIRLMKEVNHDDTPVIVLSGQIQDESLLNKLQAYRIQDIFYKPFSPGLLRERINQILASHVVC